ncbi:beta-ketoacyl-ACP reductase [Sulfodiicoccus acidiphilus]|uniref:Beta-ketoacyl-ACP reductase n=1 Tax=Sulfodiicoccus acidiphilus TaxID=1670455 RepID=A0A348B3V1_9CREN|nr:beta-ketoacyl-ACP reductase [Sulfodiicoccus acidiphilus]BBD72853.1 beta-ketoacyl-ACP reductase [Sulfodiicoccus acidiphilus]GGT88480.1 beta-ketoacyl-ACP reductase [Sulfodiicoccus acidiphilus]
MDLSGKLAIVTGASGGLGAATVRKLASLGASVAAVDVRKEVEELALVVSKETGSLVIGLIADVKDLSSCERMYAEAKGRSGKDVAEILVNNAGINRDALFVNMTYEQWDEVIKVDLYSMFNVTKQVVPDMIRASWGRIINVSSLSAWGNVGQANYAAAKAGVIGFTKTLAKELARYNITVNAIAPGFIDTPMTRSVPEKVRKMILDKIPAKRIGKPEEVANVIAFLASEEASYVTGEVVGITGGLSF